jgi:hypothetical protein
VHVSSELPIGDDQEEPVYEEEDTRFLEEGKWFSPSAYSLLNLYNYMLLQCYYLLLCIKLMGKHLFKDLSYGPPWAHYLGGYQDRLLGGPLGLLGLRYTAPEGVEHKDSTGVVLG